MAKAVNKWIYAALGGRRLSVDASEINLQLMGETADASALEDVLDQAAAAPLHVEGSIKIFTASGVVQAALQEMFAGDAAPSAFVVAREPAGAVGSSAGVAALHTYGVTPQYERGVVAFAEIPTRSNDFLGIGQVIYNNLPTANGLGASEDGPGIVLPAVSASQKLIGSVCVVAPPGVSGTAPTLAGEHQSDTSAGFPAPVTRHTFAGWTNLTAGEYWEIAGPITDTHHRLSFTVGGTSPKYFLIAGVAITDQ